MDLGPHSPVFESEKLWAVGGGVDILHFREFDWQAILVGILGFTSNSLFELFSGRMYVLIVLRQCPLWGSIGWNGTLSKVRGGST